MRTIKFLNSILLICLVFSSTLIIWAEESEDAPKDGYSLEIAVSVKDKKITVYKSDGLSKSGSVDTNIIVPEGYELVYVFTDKNDEENDFSYCIQKADVLAEKTIEYAKKILTRLEEKLEDAETDLNEEIQEYYNDGLNLLENAELLYDENEYFEAYREAVEAIRALGRAYRLASFKNWKDPHESVPCSDISTLERFEAYIDHVKTMMKNLESKEIETTEISSLINELEEKMSQASEYLSQEDEEAFNNAIDECRTLIKEIMKNIRLIAREKRQEKAETFAEEFKDRIQKMHEMMDRFKDKIGHDKIYKLKKRLARIFENPRLSKHDWDEMSYEELITILEDFVGETDSIIDDIDEDEIVKIVKGIYLLDAKSKALEKKESLLEEREQIIKDLLSNNKEQLQAIYDALETGDIETATAIAEELDYQKWFSRYYSSKEHDYKWPQNRYHEKKFDYDEWRSQIRKRFNFDDIQKKWHTP